MPEQYAKRVELRHGVIMGEPVHGKPAYKGATDLVHSYEHELIMPVGGVSKVTLRVATLQEALRAHARVRRDFTPGTEAFTEALFREMLNIQAEEDITDAMLKEMAGVDRDELKFVINRGIRPSGKKAGEPVFRVDEELALETEGYSREATLRLHTGRDRSTAEANMKTDRDEDPVGYEVQLAYLITHMGPADDGVDFTKRGDIHSFYSLTWPDFQMITAEVYARDYLPLSEILTGEVKDEKGVVQPFPGVSEEGNPEGETSGEAGSAQH